MIKYCKKMKKNVRWLTGDDCIAGEWVTAEISRNRFQTILFHNKIVLTLGKQNCNTIKNSYAQLKLFCR
jgi:NOL1/NOP2/fmu family ribosome biogenesis protein